MNRRSAIPCSKVRITALFFSDFLLSFLSPLFSLTAGPRQCLGKDFAYTEAKVMLVMLLQKYDIHLSVDPSTLKESVGLTMSIKGKSPTTFFHSY